MKKYNVTSNMDRARLIEAYKNNKKLKVANILGINIKTAQCIIKTNKKDRVNKKIKVGIR